MDLEIQIQDRGRKDQWERLRSGQIFGIIASALITSMIRTLSFFRPDALKTEYGWQMPNYWRQMLCRRSEDPVAMPRRKAFG